MAHLRYEEQDIDFDPLSPTQFEELCHDLLLEAGFFDVRWRQGGADSGRDLEGTVVCTYPVIGPITERWFVECKRFSGGVPPEVLDRKVAWARAENVDKLLIIVSSYLTDACLLWLDKIKTQPGPKILTVDGKKLKQLLLKHPVLVEKYFLNGIFRSLKNAIRDYVEDRLYPSGQRLESLIVAQERRRYGIRELAFIVVTYAVWSREGEFESDATEQVMKAMITQLRASSAVVSKSALETYVVQDMSGTMAAFGRSNGIIAPTAASVLQKQRAFAGAPLSLLETNYLKLFCAQVRFQHDGTEMGGDYALLLEQGGQGLEVLIGRTPQGDLFYQTGSFEFEGHNAFNRISPKLEHIKFG